MLQKIVSIHNLDADANPAGGTTTGVGIEIHWQDGPLGRQPDAATLASIAACPEPGWHETHRYCPCCPWTENVGRREPNGAFVESVIAAAIDRLEFYQGTKFRCRENALAITKLEEALHWCQHRTRDREARDVEGTHTP